MASQTSQDFSNLEPILRRLRTKHGPILTFHIGSRPSISITTHELAHRALVQNATIFANRPQAIETTKVIFSNHRTVSSMAYRSFWKVLRQNLASILHPSQETRREGDKRHRGGATTGPCQFHKIQCAQLHAKVGKDCVSKALEKTLGDSKEARRCPRSTHKTTSKENKQYKRERDEGESIVSYVDTLFDLRLPQENNAETELSEGEMLSLCTEFINGGTDTSTTTLQWVMAN
ncbi:hypothetical protein TEA_016017 [Camellia sinensis var. sinensis]|uniref:Cytochrome P450 n=1 Tax=Camellia sinensis var. sinensis TaxID=542762 RepID=A0A4S4DJT9_CAMSN|nr:hypothetical protein TEA_016017 [Camellia sinensis var. sinensis]